MFKKFSVVMFAAVLSFSGIANTSSAYGQCSCAPSASAVPAPTMAMPMTIPSTQATAEGYRRFSYEPTSTQAFSSAPAYGSTSMNRTVPYYGNRGSSSSRSNTPLYLLPKPERNSGRRY